MCSGHRGSGSGRGISMSLKVSSLNIGICISLFVGFMVLWGFEGSPYAWGQMPVSEWNGILLSDGAAPNGESTVLLESDKKHYAVTAQPDGTFSFKEVQAGLYSLTVRTGSHLYRSAAKVSFPPTTSEVSII